jgi:hypothetical protein
MLPQGASVGMLHGLTSGGNILDHADPAVVGTTCATTNPASANRKSTQEPFFVRHL